MKEMVGGCCVCSDERGWPDNPLVYCDGNGCTVAVHQACYGIVTVPTGPWYCKKCESPDSVKGKVRCELCPSRSGALKKADTGGWAHVVCALYIPEVRFGNVTSMEPIVLGLIPPERFTRTCYICTENGKAHRASQGACMACNKSGCKQQFHVTCAQSLGLLCEEAGNYLDNVKYCGYCQHHYSKLKKGGNVKTIPPYKPVAHDSLSSGSSSEKEGGASPMAGGSGTPTPPSKGSKGPGRKSSQNRDSKGAHASKASPATTSQPMDKKKSPSRRQSSTGDGAGSKTSTPAPSPSHSADTAHVAKASGSSSERGRDSSASRSTPPAASPSANKSPQSTGVISSVASANAAIAASAPTTSAPTTAAPAAKPTVTFQDSVIINTEAIETKHTKKRKAAAAAANAAAAAEQAAQASANESPGHQAVTDETKHNKKRRATASGAAAAAAVAAAAAAVAAAAANVGIAPATPAANATVVTSTTTPPTDDETETPAFCESSSTSTSVEVETRYNKKRLAAAAASAASVAADAEKEGLSSATESSKLSASTEEMVPSTEVQVTPAPDAAIAAELAHETTISATGVSSNFSASVEEVRQAIDEVQVDQATDFIVAAVEPAKETPIAASGESSNVSPSTEEITPSSAFQVDPATDIDTTAAEPVKETPIAATAESSTDLTLKSPNLEELVGIQEPNTYPNIKITIKKGKAVNAWAAVTTAVHENKPPLAISAAQSQESPTDLTVKSPNLEEPVGIQEHTYPNIKITIKKRKAASAKASAAATAVILENKPPPTISATQTQDVTDPNVVMEEIEKIAEEPKYTKKRRAAAAAKKETPPAITAAGKPQKCKQKRVGRVSTLQEKPVSMTRSKSVSQESLINIIPSSNPSEVLEEKLPKKRKAAVAASAIIEKVIAEGKSKASSPVAGPSEPDTRYSKKRRAAAAAASAAAAAASSAAIAAANARQKAALIIAGMSEPQPGPSRGSQWDHGQNDAPTHMDTSEKAVKKAKTDGNTPPPAHYMSPPPPPPPPLPQPPMRSPRHLTSPMPGTSAMNPPATLTSMLPPAPIRSPSQHQGARVERERSASLLVSVPLPPAGVGRHFAMPSSQGSTEMPAPPSPHVFHQPQKPGTMEPGMAVHSSHGHPQRSNWGGLNVSYEMQQDPNKPGVSGVAGTSKDYTSMPMPPMPPALRNKKRAAAMAAASMASPAPPPHSSLHMASTSTQNLASFRRQQQQQMPPPQTIYQETLTDSPPVSPNTERQLAAASGDQMYYSRMLSTAPHMLGNELNPDSGSAARLQEQLTAELAAHAIASAGPDPIVPPPLMNKAAPGASAGRPSSASSLDQLLERQWEQGSQFLMEQAQHFDIASLLSCLHQLRTENVRLEEHVTNLLQRRDHLLAVNARLAIPLLSGGVSDAAYHLQFPGPAPPAEPAHCSRDGPPRTPQPAHLDPERHAERAQVAQQVSHQMLMREVQQKPS